MQKSLFAIVLFPTFLFSQKIAEKKIDDFTHHAIIRTSWEPIVKKFGGTLMAHIRISKIDSALTLDLKLMYGAVTSIKAGDVLMLKTETDSIITLSNLEFQISCRGCGAIGFSGSDALGFDLRFILSPGQKTYLQQHKLVKLRIYTTDGYLEEDVKDKFATSFINQLKLIP